jgi:8-oxo-dGTP diphosphatase
MSEPQEKIVTGSDVDGKRYSVSTSELTWRPAAYCVVTKGTNILLVKRLHKYHLPGGGVDLGEEPSDAAVREAKEETGYQVAEPKLIDLISTFFSYETLNTHELRHVQSLLLYYACKLVDDTRSAISLDEYEIVDGLDAEWVPLDQLDSIVVGTTVDWRPVVRKFLAAT